MAKPKSLSVEQVRVALEQTGYSPTGAARLLGVTRNTVLYWMDKGALVRKVVLLEDGRENPS